TPAHVRVAAGAVPIIEDAFPAGAEIDDAVVLAILAVDVLLDQQVAPALVDLALVEGALAGEVVELAAVLFEGHAAHRGVGAVLDGGGVHPVVLAGVRLPKRVAAHFTGDVEHRLGLLGHDVVAQQVGTGQRIEFGRQGTAEVHALATGVAKVVGAVEDRAQAGQFFRLLVELQQHGALTPARAVRANHDQHGVEAGVVVDVVPVGVADRVDTVTAAAIAGIGEAHRAGAPGGRESELALAGQEGVDLTL